MNKKLILGFLLLIGVFFVISATENTYSSCVADGGIRLCDTYYCCGVEDQICPDDYDGVSCPGGDPDCSVLGCRASCVSREGYCTAGCDGLSNCNITQEYFGFGDPNYVCEGVLEGSMPDYNSTHSVICCTGEIREKTFVKLTSTEVSGEDTSLVKYTKLVNFLGKTVRLVMVVWG